MICAVNSSTTNLVMSIHPFQIHQEKWRLYIYMYYNWLWDSEGIEPARREHWIVEITMYVHRFYLALQSCIINITDIQKDGLNAELHKE